MNLAIRIDFGDQLVLSFEGAVVNLDSNEMWCFSTTQRSATLGELMRHGKELVFMGSNGSVTAVDVNGSGTAFQVGTPTQLFAVLGYTGWDAAADGKRFLMTVAPRQAQQNSQTPITVVLNRQADINRP